MTNMPSMFSSMKGVYEIFATELRGHLEYFNQINQLLSHTNESQPLSEHFGAAAKGLENRFHVIKGGSGFLQLTTISSLATTGEDWFKNATVNAPDIVQLKSDYCALIEQFTVEARELEQAIAETSES